MILSSMNYNQMESEFLKGYSSVLKKVSPMQSKIRRAAISRKQGHTFIQYVDPQKNKWGIHIYFDKKGISITPYLYYNGERGYNVITYTSEKGQFITYDSHFFKRFEERLKLDIKDPLEKINVYFLTSWTSCISLSKQNEVFAVLPFGVGLGHKAEKNWIKVKTFLSFDMLQGEQITCFQETIDKVEKGNNHVTRMIEKHMGKHFMAA